MTHDERLTERIRRHLSTTPGISEQRMFGGVAFVVNGRMAVAASEDGLLIRADPVQSEELATQTAAERMVMNGRPMKAWLRVAAASVAQDDALAHWVGIGTRCAGSLPPKSSRLSR